MKKAIYIITILLGLILFLLFFLPKNDEAEVDLGFGYHYIPFQEKVFDVTSFSGNGIYVYKNHMKVPIIFPEIKKFKYDSEYIIIKQNFNMETANLIENILFMPNVYFGYDENLVPLDKKWLTKVNIDANTKLRKKIIEDLMYRDKRIKTMIENRENYFIIDKKRHKSFGPFKYREFEEVRSIMKIKIDL